MSSSIDFDDLDRDPFSTATMPADPTRIHADEFNPSVLRVHRLLGHLVPDAARGNSSQNRNVSLGLPGFSPAVREAAEVLDNQVLAYQENLNEVLNGAEPKPPTPFPHLAWEALKAGLLKDNFINEKLNEHIDEIHKAHADISLLLELNAELGALKEESSELSEKAKQLLEQLKARGIDLKKSDEVKIEEIKRLIGSYESKLRSEIQIAFTTKVQYLMQLIESLHQILLSIIRNDGKLKEKANQLTR